MANPEHLARLRAGVAAWNAWRRGADERPDLRGADLERADLAGADLRDALLIGARLTGADLTDFASVPQEPSAVAYSPLTSVPVQPVLRRGSEVWATYPDLELRGRFLPPYEYDATDALVAALPERVIGPAEREADARRAEVRRRYAEAAARRPSSQAPP